MKNVRFASPLLLALILSAVSSVCTPALASGQWKWKDAQGSIQYSDRPPPPGIPESAILARPRGNSARVTPPPVDGAASAKAAPAAAKASENELDVKRRKAEEEKLAQQKAEEAKLAKERADNCTRAKAYQRTLNDGIRVARTNAQGEREILDDKGRAEEMQRTQQVIKASCQ